MLRFREAFLWDCRTSWRSKTMPRREGELMRESAGQATLEAALLLPVMLLGMLMALQPAIILFDRAVMEAAAAEGCRLLETLAAGSEENARAFVERRLAGVPDAEAFHVGEWTVYLEGNEGSERVLVRIRHALKPVPLVGVGMRLVGFADGGGLYWQEVEVAKEAKDTWLMESKHGPQPADWIERWSGGL